MRLDGEVIIGKLADALSRFNRVLEELQRDAGANVTWVLAGLEFGSAVATARAVPLDDLAIERIPRMCAEFLSAARQVANGDGDQSRPLLRAVRDLTTVADDRNTVVFETADDELAFSAPAPLSLVRPPTTSSTKSLGTVRGRVETLSHRKGLRFSLYELANDRPVSCYLETDHEDLMRDAWGHVADVTGYVTRDGESGRPVSIRQVTQVVVTDDEGEAMGFLRARGVVKGAEPAEMIIRRIRDAS
jgi:hypothetical protein